MTARSLTLRGASYPLVLPSIRDPRLHVAAVIISVHVLGQVGLHFRVSVPQILAAILTCAVLEVALTFRQSRSFVWPASAMLTGSGVALILRAVGTRADDPWSFDAWYLFAAIAGLSLLTKYVIKYGGTHVFNPSNIGLVVAFVLLGPSRIEPLDFWWAPLNPPMLAAYAVIIVGGVLITRRLRLLALAATFWGVFAVATAVLAASGHCIVANWAFAPVCGVDYWRVVVASPEVLIFLFFMITDPRTIPASGAARIVFGVLVAIVSTLLMAPQTDEFGAKVGLLAGLVIVCAARPLLDRWLPKADATGRFDPLAAVRRAPLQRLGLIGASVLVASAAIVAAGTPARGTALPNAAEVLSRQTPNVDPSTLPPIAVSEEVVDYSHELAGAGINAVAIALAQNLALENEALLQHDAALLVAIDHGDRLVEMQTALERSRETGTTSVSHYTFDAIDVSLLVPFGRQDGLSLGLTGRGTVLREQYDAGGNRVHADSEPFHLTFAVRQATGARWMLVAVLPPGE
jgi:Na+-transporting NADH:ubiquinone oxidoreductase subunit NqrB